MSSLKKNISPTALVILDGFGHSPEKKYNAVYQAHTPTLDHLFKTYPHALLAAAGPAVGLPEKYIGNSEVGHITIGAGRIIQQDLVRITTAIQTGQLEENPALQNCFSTLAQSGKTLHIMGLLSDAGVHSHMMHLFALLNIAKKYALPVVIHAFLDGRDVAPQSAEHYLTQLENKINELGIGTIGSISGRFFAMDRDHNWERTQKIYDMLTSGQAFSSSGWQKALEQYYEQSITDEFIPPTLLNPDNAITRGDGILFFNFRPDRARQLALSFVAQNFHEFSRKNLNLGCVITLTDYNNGYTTAQVVYEKNIIENTLKDVLDQHHKTIFSIAETEKYAHVTYFFRGGNEEKLPHDTWALVPSIPAQHYIEHPHMSAEGITTAVLDSLENDPKDFYIINYANADMVGHSGNLPATIQAIECIDNQLKKLYNVIVEKMNGTLYITADHGNAEDMFDEQTQQPKTAHTTNQVPFIFVKKGLEGSTYDINMQGLADIAPFILQNMDLPVPPQMQKFY